MYRKVYVEVVGLTMAGNLLKTVAELWVPKTQTELSDKEVEKAANYWRQKFPGVALAEPIKVNALPVSNAV